MPRKKYFKYEREAEGQCATNWWDCNQFGHNQGANDCLTDLFGQKNIFSNPKPVELLRALMQIGNVKNDDIVFDFFSGSATLAHAAIIFNKERDCKVKFILTQIEENLDFAMSKASGKAKDKMKSAIAFLDSINKPHNICEIGKERIRRAGKKIKEENPLTTQDLDIGFRVLKCDSSNMEDVYFTPKEYMDKQQSLFVDNIKKDPND